MHNSSSVSLFVHSFSHSGIDDMGLMQCFNIRELCACLTMNITKGCTNDIGMQTLFS